MKIYPRLLVLFALLSASFTANPVGRANPAGWLQPTGLARVDPWVLQSAASGETEFLVFLKEQADLAPASALRSKSERGAYVLQQLSDTAARTQVSLLAFLDAQDVEYRSYWIANLVWVRGDLGLIEQLTRRPEVAHLYANPQVQMEPTPSLILPSLPEALDGIEWNILHVGAPEVWAAGYTGQGVVIGGQDTGYQWDHPALINQYRGWSGAADHNYNWHDAIHSGTNSICPPNSPAPCDDHGHGTHTMGTMVGDDGGDNQIGMAPGARWIGCRNMDLGFGTPASYIECYQWFLAPTDLNGQNPRPDLAPDIINNSWGCTYNEGCTDPNALLMVVDNVQAAGILTVHSAGNRGLYGCETVNEPAAIYAASFTVGATDSSDNIASFSSRGPVTVDGSNRPKPDISAPGTGIRSSYRNSAYTSLQGTSMAAPHVSGLAALLLSAEPALRGQPLAMRQLIQDTAVPRTTTQECGGIPGSQVPNNTYGYGRIDAITAACSLTHRLSINILTASQVVARGEEFSYLIQVANQDCYSPTHQVLVTDTLPLGAEFISASEPYSLTGRTFTWELDTLNSLTTNSFSITVRLPMTATMGLINYQYGARSAELEAVSGPPIITPLYERLHLPVIIH